MSDGFLSRWSRRKRDVARRPAEVTPEAAAPIAPGEAPSDDEVSLSPEELAQLPSLDTLTAATDLTPFLRAGVPRVLRNAALRRMWSVDPAIRDFVSEAREYAYDWNTPGGVPGTGGAISAEDVRAMVEKVFGGGDEKSTPNEDSDNETSAGSPPLPSGRGVGGEGGDDSGLNSESPAASTTHRDIPGSVPPSRDLRSPLPLSDTLQRSGVSPGSPGEGIPRHSTDRREAELEPPTPPRLRRHGGALPI